MTTASLKIAVGSDDAQITSDTPSKKRAFLEHSSSNEDDLEILGPFSVANTPLLAPIHVINS